MINSFRQLSRSMKAVFSVGLLLIIVFGVSTARLYTQIRALQNPQAISAAEIKKVVASVARFIVLPSDENPTMATVSDPEKLRDQVFFAQSEVGDKVLIYSNARKAILWRPSINKIIEVSALNVGAPQASSAVKK